jgi:hypothetical protein
MENKKVRLCGSTWVYCDGMCNNCSRKYSVATNKTLFEINSKSALDDSYTEGARDFCEKLKRRIGVPGRYSGEYIQELADNILERLVNKRGCE